MTGSTTMDVDTDVVIVGAGSTGLLLAQGLKAAGIPFRIFERHSAAHTSREWSMSLHWGGEFLDTTLPPHLRERLNEVDVDPEHDFSSEKGFVQCNGESGEVIMVMPGVMPRRVSRRKLRGLLGEGVGVEYDHALVDTDVLDSDASGMRLKAIFSNTNVEASTNDNASTSTITCRCLIGCDGSRSRIRQLLLVDPALAAPQPTPYTILNFPYDYPLNLVPQLRAIHPVFKVSYHPKLDCMYMMSVLDTSGQHTTQTVRFQNLLSWKGPPSAADCREDPDLALKRLRELGSQFAAPFSTAAGNVADGSRLFVDQGAQWDPRPHFGVNNAPSSESDSSTTPKTFWNNRSFAGTVTLAGDAAHAMLPHRGQGLNHALEDAARLVTALKAVFKHRKESLQEAIGKYETEMVERGGKEVQVTAKAAEAGHDYSKMMQSPMFKHGANKVQGT